MKLEIDRRVRLSEDKRTAWVSLPVFTVKKYKLQDRVVHVVVEFEDLKS